jgi:hypothetical protein
MAPFPFTATIMITVPGGLNGKGAAVRVITAASE